MPQNVYTGVAGHPYEPANKQQIHAQQNELQHEGGGYWTGTGGYFRHSPGYYGFWDRQRWGWGDNQPYHYQGPSHHHSGDNDRSYYHREWRHMNKSDAHDWNHHHHWKFWDWGEEW